MIEYLLVEKDNVIAFRETIEALLNQGWTLAGGFSFQFQVVKGEIVCFYHQGMERDTPLVDVAHEVAQAVSPWVVAETPPVIVSPTQSTSDGVTSVSSCPYKAVPEY